MSAAIFKLESFSRDAPAPEVVPDNTDLLMAQARAEGFAEGTAQQMDRDLALLCEKLDLLAVAITNDEDRQRQAREQAVTALAPVLTEIVDALAPLGASQRFKQALMRELTRLASEVTAEKLCITCNEKLAVTVRDCLEQTGLREATIEITQSGDVSLTITNSTIELSSSRMADEIRSLINDINS